MSKDALVSGLFGVTTDNKSAASAQDEVVDTTDKPAHASSEAGSFLNRIIRFFEDDESSVAAVAVAPAAKPPAQLSPVWYYWIFFASGFAGLIYESVWARYLKLFLGHAAYAQVLVLAIFLFGLAAGAALCARFSERLRRPLLYYAAIEVLVALVAVYFHEIYVAAEAWATGFVFPQIGSDGTAEWFKWCLAATLILPQSILLGATFPLMSAGLIRLWPEKRGRLIAMLYFSNSFGAALGVLVSGFVLIPWAGLPGTVAFAGLINALAALAVWILGHRFDDTGAPVTALPALPAQTEDSRRFITLIIVAAFVTGLASFIYEIVWIRMLSLLFGSSEHTFELMLAAFILGLALGGWVVRNRLEGRDELLITVGKVQLVMGVFALWSLVCFPWFYDILKEQLVDWPRNSNGYYRYLLLQIGLSMLMMLPATFCAGMTLPLLTRRLLDSGGEGAIGKVYAANTLGAIIGVYVALYILLPLAGLKQALLTGVAMDMLLGAVLFAFVARARAMAAFSFSAVLFAVVFFTGQVSTEIAAAGVFLRPSAALPKVIYYRDGKTASIAVTEGKLQDNGYVYRAIKTNGKTDAALLSGGSAADDGYISDESTMVETGLLPLLYKPEAKRVMNIGFGSGLTSRTLLLSHNLKQLDNVEIEPFIVEGAQHLGSRVASVLADPRNRFILNDAKTVLTRAPESYDIIVSEPSNPWVAGIANLFTVEFYRHITAALTKEGIFVQWLPLYETTPDMIASVVKALAASFGDFHAYLSTNSNLIIVATTAPSLPSRSNAIFASDQARQFLTGYGYRTGSDVDALLLGDKAILLPYFASFPAPVNSDYFPYLQNNAPRAFFDRTFYVLGEVLEVPVPVLEILGRPPYATEIIPTKYSRVRQDAARAQEIFSRRLQEGGYIQSQLADLAGRNCPLDTVPADGREQTLPDAERGQALPDTEVEKNQRQNNAYLTQISELTVYLMPYLTQAQMTLIWQQLQQDECITRLLADDSSVAGVYTQFWRAVSLRQMDALVANSTALLPYSDIRTSSGQIVMLAAMAGHYAQGNYQQVVLQMLDLPPFVDRRLYHAARMLAAHAAEKI